MNNNFCFESIKQILYPEVTKFLTVFECIAFSRACGKYFKVCLKWL